MVEKKTKKETMRVKIEDDRITKVNKIIPFEKADGNFIGMAKFSKNQKELLFDEINALIQMNNQHAYYTDAIEKLISNGEIINYAYTSDYPWVDIDTTDDLSEAKTIFKNIMGVTD